MDILEQFLNILDSKSQSQHAVDEYEEYCHVKPDVHPVNIIRWWQDHVAEYPRLSWMALNILAIPAMSAEVERVFSSAKLLLPDSRNRLREDVIKACECLKSWNAAGLYRN